MVSSVVKKSFVGTLTLWYSMALAVSLMQERTVGWKKMQKNGAFLSFIAAMMAGGSVQTVICAIIYAFCGKQAAAKAASRMSFAFYRRISMFFWGPFRVDNAELLPPGDEACIYIGNHTSTIDTVATAFLPNSPHMAGVAKKSIMVVPGLGTMLGLSGGIFISRGKKGALKSFIEGGTDRLKRGISIGIFPQGTRKVPQHGKPLKPFKRGAFELADKTKAKIVPLTFLYPADFMSAKPAVPGMRIVVHEPIMPKGDGDVEGLMKSVEDIINAPVHAMLEDEARERRAS